MTPEQKTDYDAYLNTEGVTASDVERYRKLNIEKSIQFSEIYYHEVSTIMDDFKRFLNKWYFLEANQYNLELKTRVEQDIHFVGSKQCSSETLNFARALKSDYIFIHGENFVSTRRIPEDLNNKEKIIYDQFISQKPDSEDVIRFVGAVFHKTHLFSVSDVKKILKNRDKIWSYVHKLNGVLLTKTFNSYEKWQVDTTKTRLIFYASAIGVELQQDFDFTKHLKEASNVTLRHAERMMSKAIKRLRKVEHLTGIKPDLNPVTYKPEVLEDAGQQIDFKIVKTVTNGKVYYETVPSTHEKVWRQSALKDIYERTNKYRYIHE